jgi:hypothetical protein
MHYLLYGLLALILISISVLYLHRGVACYWKHFFVLYTERQQWCNKGLWAFFWPFYARKMKEPEKEKH